jgi:hypothetical protein
VVAALNALVPLRVGGWAGARRELSAQRYRGLDALAAALASAVDHSTTFTQFTLLGISDAALRLSIK